MTYRKMHFACQINCELWDCLIHNTTRNAICFIFQQSQLQQSKSDLSTHLSFVLTDSHKKNLTKFVFFSLSSQYNPFSTIHQLGWTIIWWKFLWLRLSDGTWKEKKFGGAIWTFVIKSWVSCIHMGFTINLQKNKNHNFWRDVVNYSGFCGCGEVWLHYLEDFQFLIKKQTNMERKK